MEEEKCVEESCGVVAVKTKEDKTFAGCCDHCLQQSVPGAIHCWNLVNYTGQIGWVGCHEFFDDREAYEIHVAKTGGCRWPGEPRPIDRLKWNGVSWEVKEEDERRSRR